VAVAATAPQVPLASPVRAFEHAWQSLAAPPPHAVLQQNPSTQLPLEQSVPSTHTLPFGSGSAQLVSSMS